MRSTALSGIALLPFVCAWPAGAAEHPLPEGARARLGSLRFRLGDNVDSVVPFPDGKRLVSVDGATVRLWDAKTGRQIKSASFRIGGRTAFAGAFARRPVSLALSSDASTVAVAQRGVVLIAPADLSGPPTLVPLDLSLRNEGVISVGFATQDNVMILLGAKGRIGLFRPGVDARSRSFATRLKSGDFLAVGSACFAVGDRNGYVGVYDLAGTQLTGLNLACSDMAVAAGTNVVALSLSGAKDERGIVLWDMKQGQEIGRIASPGYRTPLALDGRLEKIVCFSGSSSSLELWDVKTGAKLHAEPLIGLRPRVLAFLNDGTRFLAAGNSGLIRFFDGATGNALADTDGALAAVAAIQFTPRGTLLAASHDGVVREWDPKAAQVLQRYGSHAREVTALILFPKNGRFLSASLDGDLRVNTFDRPNKPVSLSDKDDASPCQSIALSPNGTMLAIGSVGVDRVVVRQADGGKVLHSLDVPKERFGPGATNALYFVDDSRLVARTTMGRILVWELATGRLIHAWDGGLGGPWAGVAVSPDRRYVASPLIPRVSGKTPNGLLGIWDLQTGDLVASPEVGNAKLTAVAFTKDNDILVGDSLGRIHFVDVQLRTVRHTFSGHRGTVTSLAIGLDGDLFASGSTDTTVIVWDLTAVHR